jgi:hypothetical protein
VIPGILKTRSRSVPAGLYIASLQGFLFIELSYPNRIGLTAIALPSTLLEIAVVRLAESRALRNNLQVSLGSAAGNGELQA